MLGARQRVERETGRIALLVGVERGAAALAPYLELFDGGGTEGVAGGDHDRKPALPIARRELADGGGFSRAVDADDEDDMRLARAVDDQRLG